LETCRSNAARRWALTLLFSLIRAVGLILLGFGILQLGLSLKSHDPSQRANGMLTIAGGIVITFTKEILDLVTGG
jgi:sulfite exporter TauE/SafE